jgi:4'-phosphopantetheinyl transferase
MRSVAPGRVPAGLIVASDQVHVIGFALDTPEDMKAAEAVLDADERQRVNRLIFQRDRDAFIVAHATLRSVLGHCLGAAPAAVRFTRDVYGKPTLADARCDLRFNLSHSGNYALLALAAGRAVGVDIELVRPRAPWNVARSFFARAEQAALIAENTAERSKAFYRCWTRKESFVKAVGCGLSLPLDAFDVSLEPSGRQLLLSDHRADRSGDWTIVSLNVPEG